MLPVSQCRVWVWESEWRSVISMTSDSDPGKLKLKVGLTPKSLKSDKASLTMTSKTNHIESDCLQLSGKNSFLKARPSLQFSPAFVCQLGHHLLRLSPAFVPWSGCHQYGSQECLERPGQPKWALLFSTSTSRNFSRTCRTMHAEALSHFPCCPHSPLPAVSGQMSDQTMNEYFKKADNNEKTLPSKEEASLQLWHQLTSKCLSKIWMPVQSCHCLDSFDWRTDEHTENKNVGQWESFYK